MFDVEYFFKIPLIELFNGVDCIIEYIFHESFNHAILPNGNHWPEMLSERFFKIYILFQNAYYPENTNFERFPMVIHSGMMIFF